MSLRPQEAPDAAELLIKEARRAKRLRRLRSIAIVLVAMVVVTVISIIQTTNKTPTKPKPETGLQSSSINEARQRHSICGDLFHTPLRLDGKCVITMARFLAHLAPSPQQQRRLYR